MVYSIVLVFQCSNVPVFLLYAPIPANGTRILSRRSFPDITVADQSGNSRVK